MKHLDVHIGRDCGKKEQERGVIKILGHIHEFQRGVNLKQIIIRIIQKLIFLNTCNNLKTRGRQFALLLPPLGVTWLCHCW